MLIVNADDWGRNALATDNILACFRQGRITSASGMVFMADSSRAARLAKQWTLDVGLHINLTEEFSGKCPGHLRDSHTRIVRFLRSSKYAQLVYHPLLREDFALVVRAQLDEFRSQFGQEPSHFDGHQHMHLCSNVLFGKLIPFGAKVRRSFSFAPGEKSAINRSYRGLVDLHLLRRHKLTDSFFALSSHLPLSRLEPVIRCARNESVELMAHPEVPEECEALLSAEWAARVRGVSTGTYSEL